MAKTFFKKLSKKGAAIKYQMDRGLSNAKFQNLFEFPNQLYDIIGIDLI